MAITTPSDLTVLKDYEVLSAPMAAEPLQTILTNTNHLYSHFCPPLISFPPTDAAASSAARSYVVACVPSADDLTYAFEHRILPAYGVAGGGTGIDVTVETNTTDDPTTTWATIYSGTTVGTTSGTWIVHSHSTAINHAVRMVRATYGNRGGGNNYQVSHILAYPSPGNVTSGVKASGFVPGDDSLIGSTGAPVNTEMLDRTGNNAISILRDRWQVLCAFGQNYYGNDKTKAKYKVPFPSSPFDGYPTPHVLLGRAVASVPGQRSLTAYVYALADVSGGSGAGLIRVKTPSVTVALDASGKMEGVHVQVPIKLTADGTEAATIPFEIWVDATAGEHTYLTSLVVLWRPGD